MLVRQLSVGLGRRPWDPNHDADLEGRAAGADGFVEALPRGCDTTLGRHFEDGHQLSGGQWQKIALSRAFMRRAPVVVLDEPTASIDAEAEAEIFGRLKDVARGATSLVIAHRFATVRMADRIVVLENGKVIENGVHQDLLRADGVYAGIGLRRPPPRVLFGVSPSTIGRPVGRRGAQAGCTMPLQDAPKKPATDAGPSERDCSPPVPRPSGHGEARFPMARLTTGSLRGRSL